MTTTAPDTTTIEEARAKLAQLEADHHAAERARDDRVREARRQLAAGRWENTTTSEAAQRRDAAQSAWGEIVGDDDADLAAIFAAWQEVRISSAVRFREAQDFASGADQHLGRKRSETTGVEISRPAPQHDPLAGSPDGPAWTFAAAVEQVIEARANRATRAARRARDAEEDALIAKAEKG